MLYRTLNWIDDQTIFLVIVDWWQWPHQEPGKTHPWSAPYMNLFQFAYQPRLGADNAVIYLLNHVYAHLNQPARTVKVMFFFLLPQCIQYHQADHPVWEADSNAGRCLSCVLDCWLPGWRFMDSFVMWCKQNYLELNITKTNELIVDFRRIMKPVTPVSIQGLHVDIVCINTLEYTLTIN